MNILWIVNNILPELSEATGLPGSASGSWLIDLSQKLSQRDDINLAIAAVGGNEFKKVNIGNVTYYLLPGNGRNMLFYTKKYEKIWKDINGDFKPDIVHLHGTEYSHGLSFLRANPEVSAVVSVQGIITRIKDVFFDGMPKWSALKYRTMRENLRFNGSYETYLLYKRNSKYEQEIFKRVNYANTVNSWDTSLSQEYNPEIKCFQIEYNLRESFYSSQKWDISNINRHQIFTNPCPYAIKGTHILLKAVALLKNRYPDISVVIPSKGDGKGNIQIINGYTKYINKLIRELDLIGNVRFVGTLNESEMLENMKKSHAVAVPSAIEGTSLVLREAMYVGVPCVASFRGGMADFIKDKENGFLYDFSEYSYLANRIDKLFSNDELAKEFSKTAILHAEKAHNREKNVNDYIEMYNYIYNKGDINE